MSSKLIAKLQEVKYIITNTDIDGIASAAILKTAFPHLELGGFSNSRDKIWYVKDATKKNSCYLDIFMCGDDLFCIDNHIIVPNSKHTVCKETKFNPNIIRERTLENYWSKYPFGTYFWILFNLEKEGFNWNIDIEQKIGEHNGEDVFLWELLLRADDALLSTFKYAKNANDWWDYLLTNNKNENSLLKRLYVKLMNDVKNQKNAQYIKDKVNNFLVSAFKNIKNDGYKNITDEGFETFFNFLNELLGNTLQYRNDFQTYEFQYKILTVTPNTDLTVLESIHGKLASLAFVSRDKISVSIKFY